MELAIGIKGYQEVIVNQDNTAETMGSGTLPVFATPAMVALMEKTAMSSILDALEENSGSVGTVMNVKHVAASPIGMKITCTSELVEVDGRRLVFHITASDSKGLIGEAEHERFIIYNEKFLAKANAKLD